MVSFILISQYTTSKVLLYKPAHPHHLHKAGKLKLIGLNYIKFDTDGMRGFGSSVVGGLEAMWVPIKTFWSIVIK